MWIRCESGVTEILREKNDATDKPKPFRIPTGTWIHVVQANDKVFIDGEEVQDAKA